MEKRIDIHFDSEKNLFIWVDQNDNDNCYCNLLELCVLFKLICENLNKEVSQDMLDDFVKTVIELKNFAMIINSKQIEYYTYK